MSYCKAVERILISGLVGLHLFNCSPAYTEDLFSDDTKSVLTIKHDEGRASALIEIAGIEMVLITGSGIKSFWIGKYEVTQELYESVMNKNPSYFKGNRLPVEQVSWFNAVEFCNRLSVRAGLRQYYTIDKNRDDPENTNSGTRWGVTINSEADGFRLPTLVEWGVAARGGSNGKYFWGDEMNGDYCWYRDNSGGKTHPVGTRKPNYAGVYDISGNVSEWCFDWHPLYNGLNRVVRDGHCNMDADYMSPDIIDYRVPHFEFGFIGIRLARNN